MSEEKPFVNVLLLGRDGVVKSLFINSFANYIKYDAFSKALRGKLQYRIPVQYFIYDERHRGKLVTIGTKGSNARDSEIIDYIFDVKNVKLRFINTPDDQNEKTLHATVTQITKYGHLNAIALIFNCYSDFLQQFEENIKPLLSQFNKATFQNVIFIFMQGKPNNIDLENITMCCKQYGVKIPTPNENTFVFHGPLFRILAIHSQGVKSSGKMHEESWDESVRSCKNLIEYVVGDDETTGLKSHFINVQEKLEALFKLLADLSCGLVDNLKIFKYHNNFVVNDMTMVPIINFEKALKSGQMVYVCNSLKCRETHEINDQRIDVIESFCPLNTSYMGNNCTACKCAINLHKTTSYLKKMTTKSLNIQDKIASCNNELREVLDMLTNIEPYTKQNLNVNEDRFVAYLRNEKPAELDYTNLKDLYNNAKTTRDNFKNNNLEDLVRCINKIKKLDWTGAAIKNILGEDFNLINLTEVEKKEKATINNMEEQLNNNQLIESKNNISLPNIGKLKLKEATSKPNLKLHKGQESITQPENQQLQNNQIKQQIDNLQVDIKKIKESIQLINNSNESQDENQALVNQRIDNLCGDMKIVKQTNITMIEDHPINQRVNNLCDDITNIKEFMQDLSNEIKKIKQKLITNVELKEQSTSSVQVETLQCNQEADDEQPKKFQKLMEDIKNLKKIKAMHKSDEEIHMGEQEENAAGETSQYAQPKFQKLIEDLSNLKKLKEQRNPNENNEMMEEVKRITRQQISNQFEDLKFFIKDTLANKQNGEDEEVHNKQEKQKKKKRSPKNNK